MSWRRVQRSGRRHLGPPLEVVGFPAAPPASTRAAHRSVTSEESSHTHVHVSTVARLHYVFADTVGVPRRVSPPGASECVCWAAAPPASYNHGRRKRQSSSKRPKFRRLADGLLCVEIAFVIASRSGAPARLFAFARRRLLNARGCRKRHDDEPRIASIGLGRCWCSSVDAPSISRETAS